MNAFAPTCLLLASALVLASASPASAQTDEEPADVSPPIEVSVDCVSTPERVKITNDTGRPLRLKSVGSTYQPRDGEAYRVKMALKPGRSVTYRFGSGKGKRLTGSFIFDNDSPREGVRVKTNRGNVRVRCTDGTNALPEPEPVEPERIVETPVEATVPGDSVDALVLLSGLDVEPETDDGYERALFEHWIDADGDGCDTRQEVLIEESLTQVNVGPGCSIEGGAWFSEADGDTLTNPASIDINHVVPLKEAWASGAHAWTPEQRRAFANDLADPSTLQAVSAGVNRQQGQSDPASWLPADFEAACRFVTDWVAIKATWGLSVDQLERDAIELTLDSCEDRTVTIVPQ